ncbi:MAG: tRNA dihydrouridine synthase DusB [Thermodesulfobacteriota bacterium]|nr:tRNA dihydrouridine synthase DusB [Thermodesulfobacteriota bacterium]
MPDIGFKIGGLRLDNPLVLAPLAGVTSLPFRLLAKEQGAALVVTEMVSAAGMCQRGPKTMKLMATSPVERPLAVQLFGAKPSWLSQAAAMAEEAGADVIDLNMGCPVRKVVRHGSGAALLKDFRLIKDILTQVRRAVRIPLTVKTRAGWSPGQGEVLDLAPILADCGVDAVTLHPRYAVQGFGGQADWDIIAGLALRFPGPVIGNGDVTRPQQVLTMLKDTGCAGVMIGRGAMGNPWIFSRALALLEGRSAATPDLDTRFRTARSHATMLKAHFGLPRAAYMLRSVLMWHTKGLASSSVFRQSINQVRDFDRLMSLLDAYFNRLADLERQKSAAA